MKKLQSLKEFTLSDSQLIMVKGGGEVVNTGAGTTCIGEQNVSYTSDCDYGNGHIQYANIRNADGRE